MSKASVRCTGRLVRSVDFQRLLAVRPLLRSAHFFVHHLSQAPGYRDPAELSTGTASAAALPVDDSPPEGCWLGLVVPKRHAKRAVTRSLLKREMRQTFDAAAAGLGSGMWLVRLRAPFDRQQFRSAASTALRQASRAELVALMASGPRGEKR